MVSSKAAGQNGADEDVTMTDAPKLINKNLTDAMVRFVPFSNPLASLEAQGMVQGEQQ